MKKILFITTDGIHIVGYTEFPIPEEISENQYLLEVDEEVLDDCLHYKIVDSALVRMMDEEYEELYSFVDPEPSEQEQINAMLMLEIARLKAKLGGVENA